MGRLWPLIVLALVLILYGLAMTLLTAALRDKRPLNHLIEPFIDALAGLDRLALHHDAHVVAARAEGQFALPLFLRLNALPGTKNKLFVNHCAKAFLEFGD